MMKLVKKTKPSTMQIVFTPAQRDQLIQDMEGTLCRSFSEYARKKIFGKPMTMYYRDRSYDEFTEAYIDFKKDLDSLLEKEMLQESDQVWLKERIAFITATVVKLYDHVRQSGKSYRHP